MLSFCIWINFVGGSLRVLFKENFRSRLSSLRFKKEKFDMRWKIIKERVVGPAEIKLEYIEKVGQFLLSKDCPSFSWNGLTICYGNRVFNNEWGGVKIERREKSLKKNRIMYSMKQKYFQILAKVSEIHICLIWSSIFFFSFCIQCWLPLLSTQWISQWRS